jgi:hypothetical protein
MKLGKLQRAALERALTLEGREMFIGSVVPRGAAVLARLEALGLLEFAGTPYQVEGGPRLYRLTGAGRGIAARVFTADVETDS